MSREYDRLAWVDYPETLTPISAANLNRMENGIANLYTDRNKMENNIAYVEEGETATRHYFINSYLMLNGIFYKTTSEINIGDILDPTLAGNIEHVDVSSQFGSGGGGSTGCVELTQAQYDALSEEAKMLDVIYLITDSPDNYLDEVFGDFASVEYTDTASKAYAVGKYLVYDSKFYKVIDAIAQGDTIVPDTNVVKTTVADEFSNASNVDYNNTTSGLTATNVQGALDEVSNAANVSYDNTTSGLTATNVQSALNEVVGKFGKDKKFGILLFSNLTTLTVPLEAVQDGGHHAAVIVIGPNQNSFATISTGTALQVNNFGTATVAAVIDGTNLKITKSPSGTFWGMTFVIVACAYPLSWM